MKNTINADIQRILKEAEKAKVNIKEIEQFFNKRIIELPKGWTATIPDIDGRRLLLINYSTNEAKDEQPLITFNKICEKAEKATGKKVKKGVYEYDGCVIALEGNTPEIEINGAKFWIQVRQCQTDKCDFEIKKQTVKVARPVGFCAEALT